MQINCLTEYEKAFNGLVDELAKCFKDSFDKTEKELGYSVDIETKKLCILIGLYHVFSKFGDK